MTGQRVESMADLMAERRAEPAVRLLPVSAVRVSELQWVFVPEPAAVVGFAVAVEAAAAALVALASARRSMRVRPHRGLHCCRGAKRQPGQL
jgi:hypothetical protein